MGLPLVGGCACGALRYEVSAAPFMVYNCHCKNCQKTSGSAFNVSTTIAEAAFAFTRGAPARLEWKSDAGSTRYGLLCGSCGSRIVQGQVPSSGVLSLRQGRWMIPAGCSLSATSGPAALSRG